MSRSFRRCLWRWSSSSTSGSWTLLSIMFFSLSQLLLLLSTFESGVWTAAAPPPPRKVYTTNKLQTEMGRNITHILNSFFSSGYDKRVRPNYAKKPVVIGVTLHIISISSVSEVQMDFTCDFYFRQGWRDPRLSFHPRPGLNALFVGADVAKQIWVPDTFFANEKSAQFHTATTPNTFIRIKANGDVMRSTRLTVTSSCPMHLHYFPLDHQFCTLEVESYGYSMTDIVYRWGIEKEDERAATISLNVSLPQFKVKDLTQDATVEFLATGNYSRLVCKLEFVRSMGYYLIQIYIPASLIVIISWVSFWLHRNASPARVQLGVTTVLTMTTLMSSTNAALPKISYIKSIDVFLGTCFVMVFAALLEYATVGYMGKRIAMRSSKSNLKARSKLTAREQQQQLHHRAVILKMQATVAAATAAAAASTSSINFMEMGGAGHQFSFGARPLPSYAYLGSNRNYGGHFNRLSPWPSLLPRLRSIAYQQPNRFRLNGEGVGGAGSSHLLPEYDFSRKKISLAPLESELGGTSTATPNTPLPADPSTSSNVATTPCPTSGPLSSPTGTKKDTKPDTLFGICPSDIDKYSRVVFPICFLCFNLAYWIIYMHISEFLPS